MNLGMLIRRWIFTMIAASIVGLAIPVMAQVSPSTIAQVVPDTPISAEAWKQGGLLLASVVEAALLILSFLGFSKLLKAQSEAAEKQAEANRIERKDFLETIVNKLEAGMERQSQSFDSLREKISEMLKRH